MYVLNQEHIDLKKELAVYKHVIVKIFRLCNSMTSCTLVNQKSVLSPPDPWK